jgi:hypothetical protein
LGLAAGFGKELLGVEMVFDGDLREQQPALTSSRNEQAVPADFNFFGANWQGRREQRYFNLQLAQLVETHGWETRILQRGAGRAADDAMSQWFFGLHNSDATAQPPADVKSDEDPALLREKSAGGNVCQYLAM